MSYTKSDQAGQPRKPRRYSRRSTLPLPDKPMAKISAKRGDLYRRPGGYAEQRDEAVGDGREPCQIVAPGCTGYVQHLHEPLSRGRAGGLEAALEHGPEPIPCCDACNRYVSENPVWAREHGLLLHSWEAR